MLIKMTQIWFIIIATSEYCLYFCLCYSFFFIFNFLTLFPAVQLSLISLLEIIFKPKITKKVDLSHAKLNVRSSCCHWKIQHDVSLKCLNLFLTNQPERKNFFLKTDFLFQSKSQFYEFYKHKFSKISLFSV